MYIKFAGRRPTNMSAWLIVWAIREAVNVEIELTNALFQTEMDTTSIVTKMDALRGCKLCGNRSWYQNNYFNLNQIGFIVQDELFNHRESSCRNEIIDQ